MLSICSFFFLFLHFFSLFYLDFVGAVICKLANTLWVHWILLVSIVSFLDFRSFFFVEIFWLLFHDTSSFPFLALSWSPSNLKLTMSAYKGFLASRKHNISSCFFRALLLFLSWFDNLHSISLWADSIFYLSPSFSMYLSCFLFPLFEKSLNIFSKPCLLFLL